MGPNVAALALICLQQPWPQWQRFRTPEMLESVPWRVQRNDRNFTKNNENLANITCHVGWSKGKAAVYQPNMVFSDILPLQSMGKYPTISRENAPSVNLQPQAKPCRVSTHTVGYVDSIVVRRSERTPPVPE